MYINNNLHYYCNLFLLDQSNHKHEKYNNTHQHFHVERGKINIALGQVIMNNQLKQEERRNNEHFRIMNFAEYNADSPYLAFNQNIIR